MNLIDVNLLLHAYDEDSRLHPAAKRWLTAELNSIEPTALTLSVMLAFARIATSERIFARPMTIDQACAVVDSWLSLPSVHVLGATEQHWPLFVRTAMASQARGPLVPDCDLAVYAIEHGATLCTHDRDFARFPRLRVKYPLAEV